MSEVKKVFKQLLSFETPYMYVCLKKYMYVSHICLFAIFKNLKHIQKIDPPFCVSRKCNEGILVLFSNNLKADLPYP